MKRGVQRIVERKPVDQILPPAPVQHNPEVHGYAVRWSAVAVEQHMGAIESLLLNTYSEKAIIRTMRARYGLMPGRVHTLVGRVKARWMEEDRDARASYKSAQMRRIIGYIRDARGERNEDGTWKVRPNYAALRSLESLLADLQGTRAPIEIAVDVRVGAAMSEVLAGMTKESLTERLVAARERKALAERARALLEAQTIDAKAEQ